MNGFCSHERLQLALTGTLSADEEVTLHRHLEDCEWCAAEMERLAGGEQASQEIAELLVPDGFDAALPLRDECSTADFVVDHLEPSDDPAVLGRLGGYDVLDIIGRGGMGVVLKGFDPELRRFVAIKALAPHLAHSALARKRFAREAQAAAAVVNLHVIAIHQVQPNGQLPFLVMPLLAGESLAQRIKTRGTLELNEILRIGMQAAEGLAAAHGQGLIHRDVKPANILLEKGVERAVLTDFGLARAADDVSMTRQGVVAGTPEYMSPEQARGEALDGRSDLFSLGCALYEMATGVSPFRTDSTMATLRRIVDEQPAAMASLAPELPPWFSHIVERLLSKDPAQRFDSASEVSHLLEQCLSHLQQPTSMPLPMSLVSQAKSRRSMFNSFRKGVFAVLGTIGLTLLGMVLMNASERHNIAGQWLGDDWGVVVLKESQPGAYEGSFTGTVPKKTGTVHLKWSRIERRFNGTWSDGDHRRGKISLRVVDGEIHGAWTTAKSKERERPTHQRPEMKNEESQPGTRRLGDLLWVRPAKIQETEHVFGGERIRVQLNSGGAILDSELPSILLIKTVIDDRPSSQGRKRVAEMIDRCGNERLKFPSGSRLKIGNHAVTILFVGENSVIVESDGRWKRWNVDQDFSDAVVLGASGFGDVEYFERLLLGTASPVNDTQFHAENDIHKALPGSPPGIVADDSLDGVWEPAFPPDVAAKQPEDQRLRLIFDGNWHAAFRGSQRLWASRLKLEPLHTPKRISFVEVEQGPNRRIYDIKGIYEVKQDVLRLSIVPDSDALPVRVDTEPSEFTRVQGKLAEEQLVALRQYSTKTATSAPNGAEKSPAKESSRTGNLQGTWAFVSIVARRADGQETKQNFEGSKERYVFEGQKLLIQSVDYDGTVRAGNEFELTLDKQVTPHRAVLKSTRDQRSFRYIYEVTGDTLRMCFFSLSDQDGVEVVAWPADFSIEKDIDKCPTLFTLKRVDDENGIGDEAARTAPKAGSVWSQAESPELFPPFELRLAHFEPSADRTEYIVPESQQKVYLDRNPFATLFDVFYVQVINDAAGQPAIEIHFASESSAQRVQALTQSHLNKPVAMLLNGKLLSAPTIRKPFGGMAVITGTFKREEAERIVKTLREKLAIIDAVVRQSVSDLDAKPVWGEAVDGLQLGLGGVCQDRHFKSGDTIRFRLSVRNVGTKTVRFDYYQPKTRDWVGGGLERTNGELVKLLPVSSVRGGHKHFTETLEPGDVASIHAFGILVLGTPDTARGNWPCIEKPEPGEYKLRAGFFVHPLDDNGERILEEGTRVAKSTVLTTGSATIHIDPTEVLKAEP